MLDLKLLAPGFGQRLVVGDFGHDASHFVSKPFSQLGLGGLCVLDGVMQDRRAQDDPIFDAAGGRQQLRKGDGMVDVGVALLSLRL